MTIVYALLSAVFAALVAIFAKIGLDSAKIDSTLATTIRSSIMFIFLLGLSFFSGKFNSFKFSDLNGKEWLFIVLSGVAGALSWLFYFYALQNGKTTCVVALDRLSIVFTAIFAYFLLSEKLSIQEIIGVILMTIGGIVISLRF